MRRLGLVGGEDRHPEGWEGVLGKDEWWLPELAGELKMPKVTLYNWIRRGWVRARQERGRHRRWVVWANEGEVERLRWLRSLPAGHHVRRKLWAG